MALTRARALVTGLEEEPHLISIQALELWSSRSETWTGTT